MKTLLPMLAQVGTLDDLKNPDFIFEQKLDGVRALCFLDKHGCRFISRNNKDASHYLPGCPDKKVLKGKSYVVDGEIIACDAKGVSKFGLLQQGLGDVQYVVFDILEKDGVSVTDLPLLERKKILAKTIHPWSWFKVIEFTNEGTKLWKLIKKQGGEGVMAKKATGLYYPAERSYDWLKIKQRDTIDCVIIGYRSAKRVISSLALGLYKDDGTLHYLGNVGTGFDERDLEQLETMLSQQLVNKRLFYGPKTADIVWVKPRFVAEIAYVEITRHGKLRIAAFIRLRPDKKAKECTLKDQVPHYKPLSME